MLQITPIPLSFYDLIAYPIVMRFYPPVKTFPTVASIILRALFYPTHVSNN